MLGNLFFLSSRLRESSVQVVSCGMLSKYGNASGGRGIFSDVEKLSAWERECGRG